MLFRWVWILFLSVLCVSCVAKIDSAPQPLSLAHVDIPATQSRVREMLLWIKAPKITQVALDDHRLLYAHTKLVGRAFVVGLQGGVQETTRKQSILLADIATAEAYDNKAVFAWDQHRTRLIASFVCLTVEDAQELARALQVLGAYARAHPKGT